MVHTTARLESAPGGALALHGVWSARAVVQHFEQLDRATALVADEATRAIVARSGLRTPLVESVEAVPDLSVVDDRPDIRADHVGTGAGHRRTTTLGLPAWTTDAAVEHIRARAALVDPGLREYLAAHERRFAETFALVPEAPPGARALDVSAFAVTCSLLSDLGYWTAGTLFAQAGGPDVRLPSPAWADAGVGVELWWDAELHRLPCDDEMFDLVMAAEIIEHLPTDPVQLLVESNRVLRLGGQLIVTTPNVVSARSIAQATRGRHPFNHPVFDRDVSMDRHHIEYTPDMLDELVRAAGFVIERSYTADVWFDDEPEIRAWLAERGDDLSARGDCLFVVARKVTDIVDRTPPGIYSGEASTWSRAQLAHPRRGVRR